ncbi:MAG TPA: YiaA/YiaB family inner membrane protein [Acidimicrobiales bacterium]
MTTNANLPMHHSTAWVFQTQVAFAVSSGSLGVGIAYLPVTAWERAFLALAALFTVSSTISLSKTLRDQHEARNVVARVDEVKLERLLSEHDPFHVPPAPSAASAPGQGATSRVSAPA